MKKKKLEEYKLPFFRVDDFMFALDQTQKPEVSMKQCTKYVIRLLKDLDRFSGLNNIFQESSKHHPHKEVIKFIRKVKV